MIPIPPKSTNGDTLIVPHIGWSALEISGDKDSWDNSILNNTPVKSHVYFVHSFFSKPNNKEHLLAHCNYGGNNLSAVICRDNVMGCQFHPEFSSTPHNPNPLFLAFIHAAFSHKQTRSKSNEVTNQVGES